MCINFRSSSIRLAVNAVLETFNPIWDEKLEYFQTKVHKIGMGTDMKALMISRAKIVRIESQFYFNRGTIFNMMESITLFCKIE